MRGGGGGEGKGGMGGGERGRGGWEGGGGRGEGEGGFRILYYTLPMWLLNLTEAFGMLVSTMYYPSLHPAVIFLLLKINCRGRSWERG